jgi:hypothetical protein
MNVSTAPIPFLFYFHPYSLHSNNIVVSDKRIVLQNTCGITRIKEKWKSWRRAVGPSGRVGMWPGMPWCWVIRSDILKTCPNCGMRYNEPLLGHARPMFSLSSIET